MMNGMPDHLPRACAPVPTPIGEDHAFDPGALASHLDWLEDRGLDGALILGTNGEFPSFSLAERTTIAAAAGGWRGTLRMLLGVGSCALPEVLELTRCAADHGYTAVLCPPPFYFRGAAVEGLAAFFLRLLDEAALPVLLYHIPQVTGIPIDDRLLEAIGVHQRLAGVKDSSGDPAELKRLARRFRDGAYYVGNDRLATAGLAEGGQGSISAAASVVPGVVARLADEPWLQSHLDAVRNLLEEYGLGPSVKAILLSRGFGRYSARPPMIELASDRRRELLDRFDRLVDAVGPRIAAGGEGPH